MFKNPGCQCCDRWADYMRDNGFTVTTNEAPHLPAIKAEHSISQEMAACHTAFVGGANLFREGQGTRKSVIRQYQIGISVRPASQQTWRQRCYSGSNACKPKKFFAFHIFWLFRVIVTLYILKVFLLLYPSSF